MKISTQYKGFLIFSGLLMLFNLLVMNDLTSVLEGAEAENILYAQKYLDGEFTFSPSILQLPDKMLISNYEQVGLNLFLLRLPNMFLLVLAFFGFFFLGKKLFGKSTILLTLVVVSSTFLVIPAAKFVTDDLYLFVFQLLAFVSLIRMLKQPIWKWKTLFWLFTILAICVNYRSALVFSFGSGLFLFFAHPNGKKLFKGLELLMGVGVLVIIGFRLFIGYEFFSGAFFDYFQTAPGEYFLAQLIGVLPWLAFLPAALWDLLKKLRKREEMAIISFAFLLFSLLSYSLILQIALAFLIAKQVENFFKPNYPHTNLVKSFAVLNLLFSFLIVATFLLTGYENFGDIGFRSRMGVCGVYWAFGFLAVIGVFGAAKKMIVGGMALSGMLTLLLFWTQVAPLLENYRNLPQKIISEIERNTEEEETPVYFHRSFYVDYGLSKRQEIYLRGNDINFGYFKNADSLKGETGIFILDQATFIQLDSAVVNTFEKTAVTGRNDIFDADKTVWVLKKVE